MAFRVIYFSFVLFLSDLEFVVFLRVASAVGSPSLPVRLDVLTFEVVAWHKCRENSKTKLSVIIPFFRFVYKFNYFSSY